MTLLVQQLRAEIEQLQANIVQLEKSLKIVQSHANTAYSRGRQAGIADQEHTAREAMVAMNLARDQMMDENERFTDLLEKAEHQRDQLKAENAELIGLMRGVVGEFPHRHKSSDGNGPGHGHRIPGVWDSDNGELAGKPCAWCSIWNAAKGIVERHEQAMTKEQQP